MTALPLTAVAGWDVPLLRGAVFTLTAVADRLPSWRGRMEAVGRALGDAACWYGPAATAAGAALVQVSTVATAVTAALGESLDQAGRLLGAADTAQDLAEQALATAATVPVPLDQTGRVAGPLPGDPGASADAGQAATALRAEELASEALRNAALAGLAAAAAGDALAGLGVGSALLPTDFGSLSALVAAVPTPAAVGPRTGGPDAVAAWWAALPVAARMAAVRADPARIGALDGVPAWARDEANRLHLDRVLARPDAEGREHAEAVAREIADREAGGERVQLYQFVPEEGLVALALGDVDTADAVALLVPGVFNTPDEDLDGLVDDASAVAGAAAAAAGTGATVAAIAWMGYRTPQSPVAAVSTGAARRGGPALAGALDGLAAVRVPDAARVTVVAHSYGTVVLDRAADAPGDLAADSVVLLGSPGLDNDAEELEAPEVHESSSLADPINWFEAHGEQTWERSFGAARLPTELDTPHSGYYDVDRPTLAAIGEVVAREQG